MEKLSGNTNALNWFEIPVIDMSRAKKFYESILDINMIPYDMPAMQGLEMTMFSDTTTSGKVGGALVKSEMHKPSTEGAVVYLNCNPTLQTVLDRVESAGGKVIVPRTSLGENGGCWGIIMDTEGNATGLHAGN